MGVRCGSQRVNIISVHTLCSVLVIIFRYAIRPADQASSAACAVTKKGGPTSIIILAADGRKQRRLTLPPRPVLISSVAAQRPFAHPPPSRPLESAQRTLPWLRLESSSRTGSPPDTGRNTASPSYPCRPHTLPCPASPRVGGVEAQLPEWATWAADPTIRPPHT